MKILLHCCICCILCSCAETRIYENGHVVCIMQGDYTNLTFRTSAGTYFHADVVNHSTATIAVGNNIVKGIGSLGTAAASVAAVVK